MAEGAVHYKTIDPPLIRHLINAWDQMPQLDHTSGAAAHERSLQEEFALADELFSEPERRIAHSDGLKLIERALALTGLPPMLLGLRQLEASVTLDAEAPRLGLVRGQTHPMAIFHAERHTTGSNYRIETNISCFTIVEPPPPPALL